MWHDFHLILSQILTYAYWKALPSSLDTKPCVAALEDGYENYDCTQEVDSVICNEPGKCNLLLYHYIL